LSVASTVVEVKLQESRLTVRPSTLQVFVIFRAVTDRFVYIFGLGDGRSEQQSVDHGTSESNHRKTAMNDFGFLAVGNLIGRHVLQLTSIETQVTWFTFSVVHVEGGKLNGSHTEEDLDIDTESHLRDGSKDITVGVGVTGQVDSTLLDERTEEGEHADASVLNFGPTSIFEVGLNVRKTHWVESHISRHGSVQLFGSDQERNGFGHFLGVQGNGSRSLGLLWSDDKSRKEKVQHNVR